LPERAHRGGVFGIISQGFPQLVRVNAEVVKADPDYVQPSAFRCCAGPACSMTRR